MTDVPQLMSKFMQPRTGCAQGTAGHTAGIPLLREPSSLLQGEEKAALEPQQSFLKGRVLQGEKMWCLGPKAGPGALL